MDSHPRRRRIELCRQRRLPRLQSLRGLTQVVVRATGQSKCLLTRWHLPARRRNAVPRSAPLPVDPEEAGRGFESTPADLPWPRSRWLSAIAMCARAFGFGCSSKAHGPDGARRHWVPVSSRDCAGLALRALTQRGYVRGAIACSPAHSLPCGSNFGPSGPYLNPPPFCQVGQLPRATFG